MSGQSQSSSISSEWLLGLVKNNPEGLLLLAAGCALLLRSGSSSSRTAESSSRHTAYPESSGRYEPYRSHYDQAAGRESSARGDGSSDWKVGERVGEGLSQAAAGARDYASGVTSQVAGTASSVADAASSYAASASSYASAASEQSGRFARQAQSTIQDTINHVVQEQPLMVALAGLAAGAAIAAAFPVTEIEKRTLGAAGEQLTEAAGQLGEQFKEGAQKAGERIMSAAEERGMITEGVKEIASEAAGAFGSAFSSDDQSSPNAQSKSSGASGGQSAQGKASGGSVPSQDLGTSAPSIQGGNAWSKTDFAHSGGKRGS